MFVTNITPADEAETTALAIHLKHAINSSLSVDELKAIGLPKLKELKAKQTPTGGDFAGYSINAHMDGGADEGELLRLVSHVRSAVAGASGDALKGLGLKMLEDLKSKLSSAQNGFADYSLNSHADDIARLAGKPGGA